MITVPKKDVLIVLYFFGQFSLNLRSRLHNFFNKTLPKYNIKFISQSKNRLSNRFWFQDSITKELRSHLVYRLLCWDYVETERHLNIRSWEYLSLSALTGKRETTKNWQSKITACFLIPWVRLNNFQFWRISQIKLLIKESLLVSRDRPLLNKQVKSIPLQLYYSLLQFIIP